MAKNLIIQYERADGKIEIEELLLRTIPEPNSGCWIWLGGTDRGYAVITKLDHHVRVARIILEDKLGRPIKPGMLALHTCDVRPCLNREHLYEGTHGENLVDSWTRGTRRHTKPRSLDKMSRTWDHPTMNAKELKKVRTKLNMTQPELADRLRITWRTVARWEAGAKIPETVRLALREVQREEGLTV